MRSPLVIPLQSTSEQAEGLHALQRLFSKACNHLAPLVRETRCWNRVALHHLAYRDLRQHFPRLGSQMACNVIYSVSRAARVVYQHPNSPWNQAVLGEEKLPLLRFMPDSPVYYDRHTLSLGKDGLSLFTLDGRMRLPLEIGPSDLDRLVHQRLREVILTRKDGAYVLSFWFVGQGKPGADFQSSRLRMPDYVSVQATPPRKSGHLQSSQLAEPV